MQRNIHQDGRSLAERGFTIVELLIVIVVIAILAAIVIVSYNGIREQAKEATLLSDLSQGAKSVGVAQIADGLYPAEGDENLRETLDNELSYFVSPDRKSFCIEGETGGKTFVVSSTKGSPVRGYCDGFVAVEGEYTPPEATIFAGNGTNGYGEGSGTSAVFGDPHAVAVDSSGNVYVADTYNHRIRKITPAGVVSTLAGYGSYGGGSGFVNATGTSARFNNPKGVAVDSSGNVYVADTGNNSIRKITPAGVVTTFAGSSTSGTTNATGTSARFNAPQGVAVDSSGNIYVADTGNHRIRMITPAQVVTTVAGSSSGWVDATGTSARFNGPVGIAVAPSGNIYISDTNNHAIRMMTTAGVVTSIAGDDGPGYEDSFGDDAEFDTPRHITVDAAGNIYVADRQNNAIRKVTPAGQVTTHLEGAGGTLPQGIAAGSDGALYVSTGNHYVYKID